MGHAIERFARQRGHQIVAIIDHDNIHDFDSEGFLSADVAIEFTSPASAVDNYRRCFDRGIKVVSGSTGWRDHATEVERMCRQAEGTFLWSSNYSVGVNIFFALNTYLASVMSHFPQYTPSIKEIHHIHKLDHPSGTAITLATEVIAHSPTLDSWSESQVDHALLIEHEREGEVPGTHIVTWDSPVDTITIEHRAKSRDGFALGAVMAAEWAATRQGVLSLDDMYRDLIAR
ncbi:MAG: 4-hydroxy-tetrahydrodipicolinate reductase, partial [Muribaculaceae bacterium]|nr:4-hydroxy-tetrahydrodipicolinate reductase [Muribaculaceae bacterium]